MEHEIERLIRSGQLTREQVHAHAFEFVMAGDARMRLAFLNMLRECAAVPTPRG